MKKPVITKTPPALHYSLHVIVRNLTRTEAEVIRHSVFPFQGTWFVDLPNGAADNEYYAHCGEDYSPIRISIPDPSELEILAEKIARTVKEVCRFEHDVSVTFKYVSPYHDASFVFLPDDWCKGCGHSAAALGTTLDENGFHRGCAWANSRPDGSPKGLTNTQS